MISVDFLFEQEIITVRVNGNNLLFGKQANKGYFATLDQLKFSYSGVIKEFPDLKDNKDWKDIALERLKEKIKNMKTEFEVTRYIINDLSKFGYKPLRMQRQGSRTKEIKDGII